MSSDCTFYSWGGASSRRRNCSESVRSRNFYRCRDLVAQSRVNMVPNAAFAGTALGLACVGVYGVIAWSVAQWVREIGVRMALGATRRQISLLFMRRVLLASLIGVADGTCGALAVTRLLRNQLYGVAPNDPAVYVVSIVFLVAPVWIATIRPALIAASVHPIQALRVE